MAHHHRAIDSAQCPAAALNIAVCTDIELIARGGGSVWRSSRLISIVAYGISAQSFSEQEGIVDSDLAARCRDLQSSSPPANPPPVY